MQAQVRGRDAPSRTVRTVQQLRARWLGETIAYSRMLALIERGADRRASVRVVAELGFHGAAPRRLPRAALDLAARETKSEAVGEPNRRCRCGKRRLTLVTPAAPK